MDIQRNDHRSRLRKVVDDAVADVYGHFVRSVGCGDTGVAKPLTYDNDADARVKQMYWRHWAHAAGCERSAASVVVTA